VCRAARQGAKEWLRKLPRLLECGGRVGGGEGAHTGEVWRLDLGELRRERLPDLTTGRFGHACCAVRGGVVVLGGLVAGNEPTASVEILGRDSSGTVGNIFKIIPPLSCGPIRAYVAIVIDASDQGQVLPIIGSAAIVIDKSESDQGQVLIIGGRRDRVDESLPICLVCKVDLATGECTAQS